MTTSALATPHGKTLEPTAPPGIESLEDTGLSRDFLVSLIAKILHQRDTLTGFELADAIAIPFTVLDELLVELQSSRLTEVRETDGPARSSYRFALTAAGRQKASEAFAASQYVGPAPVPFGQYVEWTRRQSVNTVSIDRAHLEEALAYLVLPDGFLDSLGPAVNSGKSLFLYGDPGNGKTRIAEGVASAFGEAFYVPFAVDLDGHVAVLYDPVYHEALDPEVTEGAPDLAIFREVATHDRRFVKVRRPVVVAGGELDLSQLDLRYDPFSRTYQAPVQLKANGGVLVIDDLGRQRVPPRALLNRWIVPLEHRVDHLTLHSGKKITVPFDCLVVFSTNIDPAQLVEEAFLRRIHYKIHVPDPDERRYDEIFDRCCLAEGIAYDPDAPELIRREYYRRGRAWPRGCHPRDILSHLRDIAAFNGHVPVLSPTLLRKACDSYFVPLERGTSTGLAQIEDV
jgi:predicted ATPase with chaperone activity